MIRHAKQSITQNGRKLWTYVTKLTKFTNYAKFNYENQTQVKYNFSSKNVYMQLRKFCQLKIKKLCQLKKVVLHVAEFKLYVAEFKLYVQFL